MLRERLCRLLRARRARSLRKSGLGGGKARAKAGQFPLDDNSPKIQLRKLNLNSVKPELLLFFTFVRTHSYFPPTLQPMPQEKGLRPE